MQFYNSLLTTLGSASWLAYVKLINNKDIVVISLLFLLSLNQTLIHVLNNCLIKY